MRWKVTLTLTANLSPGQFRDLERTLLDAIPDNVEDGAELKMRIVE